MTVHRDFRHCSNINICSILIRKNPPVFLWPDLQKSTVSNRLKYSENLALYVHALMEAELLKIFACRCWPLLRIWPLLPNSDVVHTRIKLVYHHCRKWSYIWFTLEVRPQSCPSVFTSFSLPRIKKWYIRYGTRKLEQNTSKE